MKALKVTKKVVDNLSNTAKNNYILKGLQRKGVAFINAAPDTGKSFLSLSIAVECATSLNLLGLKLTDDPLKVAYWPAEDNIHITGERLQEVLDNLDSDSIESIGRNFALIDSIDPICSSKKASEDEKQAVSTNKARLINILIGNKTKVLIIDTVRSAIGSADEVDDDYQIKKTIVDIAEAADCAIFIVHHVTKAVAQGKVTKSAVSQSGLSILGSYSKLHLMLHHETRRDVTETILSFSKANYLKQSEKEPVTVAIKNGLMRAQGFTRLKPSKPSKPIMEPVVSNVVVDEIVTKPIKEETLPEDHKPQVQVSAELGQPKVVEISTSFVDNSDLYTDEQLLIIRKKEEKKQKSNKR
ncbi:AAA family ATPase [Shewanella sp. UCD-KL12]|uniref:AAA family ATPase n=1 Tax=Shewanella sp. UCD-KL12 TaxID=1917163 RepID=UPI0009705C62|nr:AAA family ATPase [Shewanella sp. UCD-KL12]